MKRRLFFIATALLLVAAVPAAKLHPPDMKLTKRPAPRFVKEVVASAPGASDILAFSKGDNVLHLVQLSQRTGAALVYLKEKGAKVETELADYRGFLLETGDLHIALMNNGEANTVLVAVMGPDGAELAENYAADFRGTPRRQTPHLYSYRFWARCCLSRIFIIAETPGSRPRRR
ncbi:MAG: hypothetical protein U5N86_06865 [Planctomycetota bacterium]|nr:hypothetical protein [Planctomycetota bacterium]